MRATKHLGELCALLVGDLFGELPSRILSALLSRGRCSVPQLSEHTALDAKQLLPGIVVLIQHNLLFHNVDEKTVFFEANAAACYNLLRAGRIIEMVEARLGKLECQIVQFLLQKGHARISDILSASATFADSSEEQSHADATDDAKHQTQVSLARLLQAEVVDVIPLRGLKNPDDIWSMIEKETAPPVYGTKSAKDRADLSARNAASFHKIAEESRELKKMLDAQSRGFGQKRRRLGNGVGSHVGLDLDDVLNPEIIVKVNSAKCLVEIRNDHIARLAKDAFGETTGAVYLSVLQLLTANISSCTTSEELDETPQEQVSTLEVLHNLDENLNLLSGIGKTEKDKVDVSSMGGNGASEAMETDEVGEGACASDVGGDVANETDLGEDEDVMATPTRRRNAPNGAKAAKVSFDEVAKGGTESRASQLRRHLLLLAESPQGFLQTCGSVGHGTWTVNFAQVVRRLQLAEMDAVIEQSFGRHGLRLTRILRDKGKLDEKGLPSLALMKKSDVQGKMLAMQMAGIVDVQEVPRDNSRLANRTMFFWFYDGDRYRKQLLDDMYKTMVRCLQLLAVERQKEQGVLSFVDRTDVKGKESEVMDASHLNRYNLHLEVQSRLLGQVMRLDDVVTLLQDY